LSVAHWVEKGARTDAGSGAAAVDLALSLLYSALLIALIVMTYLSLSRRNKRH
jgi:hypothetical protein